MGEVTIEPDGRGLVRGLARISFWVQRREMMNWAARRVRWMIAKRGHDIAAVAAPRVEQLARRVVARSPRGLQGRAQAAYRRLRRR